MRIGQDIYDSLFTAQRTGGSVASTNNVFSESKYASRNDNRGNETSRTRKPCSSEHVKARAPYNQHTPLEQSKSDFTHNELEYGLTHHIKINRTICFFVTQTGARERSLLQCPLNRDLRRGAKKKKESSLGNSFPNERQTACGIAYRRDAAPLPTAVKESATALTRPSLKVSTNRKQKAKRRGGRQRRGTRCR